MQRPPQQIIPVEAHLAYWLHYVGYRLAHKLRLRMRQVGVTAAESVLLRKLHEHEQGAMPSLLAHQLGLSRDYISRLAVRLEAKGLIHREKSLSDRRTLVLTLTDAARVLLPYLASEADKTNARYFAGPDEAAHETVERVMKGIVFRHRFRFVPPIRCHIRKYRYLYLLQLGIDWDGEGNGASEEFS
jgi:DNA-binding MarR family transcriptional regulator